ncbi:MAG: hypothetical protein ACYDAZ_09055, partial [Thermoplasmataceae archaeon]
RAKDSRALAAARRTHNKAGIMKAEADLKRDNTHIRALRADLRKDRVNLRKDSQVKAKHPMAMKHTAPAK